VSFSAWRIVQEKWVEQAFDGEGARRFGGRWNSPGTPLIYASGSRALAVLEILVHLQIGAQRPLLQTFPIEMDEGLVEHLPAHALPVGWNSPAVPRATQDLGDQWARGHSAPVLRVPSVFIPEESNFLINPLHPEFKRLRMGKPIPFTLDPRLIAR